MKIKIQRTDKHSGAILGRLSINGKTICDTLELPWRNNHRGISCVPNGKYGGFARMDGNRGWRIELTDTGARKHIQIHVGNFPHQIEGCILVGEKSKLRNFVGNSKIAMGALKQHYRLAQMAATYGPGTIRDSVPEIPVSIDISGSVPVHTSQDDLKYLRQYLREGRNTRQLDAHHLSGWLA